MPQVVLTDTHRYFCGPKYFGIYTKTTAGQAKFSALTEAGNAKFDALRKMVVLGRTTNRANCRRIEKQVLKHLRNDNGVFGDDHDLFKRRKRAKPTVHGLAAADNNDFAEDEFIEDDAEELDLDNLD